MGFFGMFFPVTVTLLQNNLVTKLGLEPFPVPQDQYLVLAYLVTCNLGLHYVLAWLYSANTEFSRVFERISLVTSASGAVLFLVGSLYRILPNAFVLYGLNQVFICFMLLAFGGSLESASAPLKRSDSKLE